MEDPRFCATVGAVAILSLIDKDVDFRAVDILLVFFVTLTGETDRQVVDSCSLIRPGSERI